jgi:predicted  nucleic acid-binding Zn-ribbon protein
LQTESELIELLKAKFEIIRDRKATIREFMKRLSNERHSLADEIEKGRAQDRY